MDSMMLEKKCTIIVMGRFNLFSCHRKYITHRAFLAKKVMFNSYLRSR